MDRIREKHIGRHEPQLLPAPADTRERLIALYRKRDALDAEAFASGRQRMRGQLYALGAEKLESGDDVYESYGVVAAAGVELPPEALRVVASLPQAWARVCRIDSEGRMWTASLSEKGRRHTQ